MAGKKLKKALRKVEKLRKKLKSASAPASAARTALVSPLAPKNGFPALPVIAGVRFATAQAGVRYKGRTDVMLVELARRHHCGRRVHPILDPRRAGSGLPEQD